MTDPSALIVIAPTDAGFAVTGEIDAHTAPAVAAAIAEADHAHDHLVIDMAGVDFVDSSGLRVLIEAHRSRRSTGRSLSLADPSPVVRRLFDIAGVDGYLDIEGDPHNQPSA